MSQEKECCVCYENFETNRCPKLSCDHTVCQECYDQLRNNNCPLCRTPFRSVNPNIFFESEEHRQLIDDYRNWYDDEYLMGFPEFSQKKINLDENLLTQLPVKELRTREQVIDWMTRNLTYNDLIYIGW